MNTIKKITRFFTTPRNDWNTPEFSARGNGLIDLCCDHPEAGKPVLEERIKYWKGEYRAVIKAEVAVLCLMAGAGAGFLAAHSIIPACSAAIAFAALLAGILFMCSRANSRNPEMESPILPGSVSSSSAATYWKMECRNLIRAEIAGPCLAVGALPGFLSAHNIASAAVPVALLLGLVLMCRRESAIRERLKHFYGGTLWDHTHPEDNDWVREYYPEWFEDGGVVDRFGEAATRPDADALAEQKKFERIVSGFGTNYTNTTLRN